MCSSQAEAGLFNVFDEEFSSPIHCNVTTTEGPTEVEVQIMATRAKKIVESICGDISLETTKANSDQAIVQTKGLTAVQPLIQTNEGNID